MGEKLQEKLDAGFGGYDGVEQIRLIRNEELGMRNEKLRIED